MLLNYVSNYFADFIRISGRKIIGFLIAVSLFLISSCSVIKVSTVDDVKIYRKFGFINVVSAPETGAYVDLNFVGIGIADDDLILGYKNSKTVIMPDDACTVFIDKKSDIDISIISYLKKRNCNFIYLQEESDNE